MKKAWFPFAVLLLAGCMGWVPGRQSHWDAKVREMCEKDGGVHIFEKLRISRADVDLLGSLDGKIDVPLKRLAKPNSPAYADMRVTNVNEGNPQVTRTEATIVRQVDGAVVARWISYARFGGDLPSPAHPSSFRCPELKQITADLQPLFIVEGESK
jgi:hypothetical protein